MKDKKEHFQELTRREFLYLSGAGMAGMTLAGMPKLGYGAEKPKYGGRLRVAERMGSVGLDAHKNQHFMDCQHYLLMNSALTEVGELPQIKIYPMLATSWEISPDGREYTFPLRKGILFHHGKELDSGDVKYSFERVMNPKTRSPRRFNFRWIDSVEAPDKYTVKIKLKEPFAPFLSTLTIRNCAIIPAGWEPTGTKPAPGTGPFVFKSFNANETSEVTRFDKYWEYDEKTGDRLPYLDGIHVRKIVDATVRWTALRAGDLDYIQLPPRNVGLEEFKKPTPGIVTVMPQPVGCAWIYFNVTKPPYDNKKVRQAIAYALDKKALIDAAWFGLGEATNNQPFLNRSRMYIPIKDREVNLKKAKQLLAEAGYPNGFKTELLEFANYVDPAQAVVGQLERIGIKASIKVLDRAPFHVALRKGQYSISVRGDSERLDPDDAYYMRLHSSEIDKNNWSRYVNKELDALVEKGRITVKWEDRVPVYTKVVEIVKEELPILYLAKSIIMVSYREYVKGHEAGMATWFGYHDGGLKKVWLDK